MTTANRSRTTPARRHRRSRRPWIAGGTALAAAAAAVGAVALSNAADASTSHHAATAKAAPAATAAAGTGRFSPYADTSLYPPFDPVATAKADGVKTYNLAFLVAGGGCTPKWGGQTALGSDPVAAKIGALRAAGGDVRVSFGGANGTELAQACSSVSALTAAYDQAVTQYKLTQVDFDIEGAAVGDTASIARRDQAIAALQKEHPGLAVSYTLPVLPSGLTAQGVAVVKDAKAKGVKIAAVNVMAMDYGDGAAPNPSGQMGAYAIKAATATQAQVKGVLGDTDADAWSRIAVTPMIGVNDTATERFTLDDAAKLVAFAKQKHLAWLSMWSAARDKACSDGNTSSAEPTCSGVAQSANAFAKAFNAYTG
ncbi:chitinase [Mangrovactinospora gilvigrisea]|uniref:chitinase n=1 Tax=Mangrovactinospora gilvigrisea TaxID=1428644 RepID=A0A1J7BAY7_9ACTN|nr:chitinase [Mangrovactinospora gilvigrisea]